MPRHAVECDGCCVLLSERVRHRTEECPVCGHSGRTLKTTTGEEAKTTWFTLRDVEIG